MDVPGGSGLEQFLVDGGIVGIVVLVFAAAIGLAIWGALRARRRREEFAAHAASRGWTYERRDDRYVDRWSGSPFDQGHNRKAQNVLAGRHDGREFVAFDYVYYTTETSTDSEGRTTNREVAHHYSVVALRHGAAFPGLTVRPEGPVGRLFGRLTNTDIQFESDAFNRAFTVNSDDRRFASDVIHPRMMELLLETPKVAFRFTGDSVLSVHTGTHSLADVDDRLALLDSVLDNVPDFVWRQATTQPDQPHRAPHQENP